jgi:hypothetical protein
LVLFLTKNPLKSNKIKVKYSIIPEIFHKFTHNMKYQIVYKKRVIMTKSLKSSNILKYQQLLHHATLPTCIYTLPILHSHPHPCVSTTIMMQDQDPPTSSIQRGLQTQNIGIYYYNSISKYCRSTSTKYRY